jgi:hypothetical protein
VITIATTSWAECCRTYGDVMLLLDLGENETSVPNTQSEVGMAIGHCGSCDPATDQSRGAGVEPF